MSSKLLLFNVLFLISLTLVYAEGFLDLRSTDWNKEKFVNLNAPWQYAESCFGASCKERVVLDISKGRLDQIGYSSFGYGTYYLDLLVNHEEPLMLKVPDYFSGYEIFANDQLLGSVGGSGMSKDETTPGRKVLYLPLHRLSSDTLKLRIQISNYTHHKRGIGNSPILLGSERNILQQKFLDDSYDTFLTGFLILATFFFLGLYFHGKQDYSILFFSLFTLSYAYRIVGWHNYVLHDMIDVPYHLGLILEYSTFYLCGVFFAIYLECLFPKDAPVILTRSFTALSLLWVFSTFLPIYIFTQLNVYYLYLLLIGIVAVCVIIIRAVWNKRPGSMYAVYSVFGVLVVFSFKTMNYLNIVGENRLVSIAGELTFFTFQALILSRNFTENWRQAKKDAEKFAQAKSDFLSVMSHEIRTPLNAVIGTTDHLMDSEPKPEQIEDLKRLKSSSDNLLALINNVLDYNKIESGKLELDFSSVNIHQFCESHIGVLEPLARRKGLDFKVDIDPLIPRNISVDKIRLGQVLMNLIGNAIKFTESGSVVFRLDLERTVDDLRVQIRFLVEDTGGGIPEADLKKIFGVFEQANSSISRQYGGAGLGLPISKRLVELMGSSIQIESEEGVGSKFWFILNCEIAEEAPDQNQTKDDFSLFENTSILLVEDNPLNILIAKRQLEKWKIKVTVAESGMKAIEYIQWQSFDLVLMDLQMPVMDGFETTRRLRELGFGKPVIALTAASVTLDELKTKGMDNILPKPFSTSDLSDKLKQYLEV